jgi:tetratricopeptide (TPR) repeat protein
MRHSLWIPAALVSIVVASIAAPCQNAAPPAAQTPNPLLDTYNKAMLGKDWAGAMTAAQQLVEAHSTAENLMLLGNAQLYSGASEDALGTYERALTQAQAEKPPEGQPLADWKDLQAKILIGRGNAMLKLHRNEDALESYQRGADLSSKPGQAYFNICATLYNIGDVQRAIPACRKAADVEPTRANTWFVLGSLLFVDAKADAQGKFILSSECRHALEKYLELAPDGPHAKDTKEMLDMSAK